MEKPWILLCGRRLLDTPAPLSAFIYTSSSRDWIVKQQQAGSRRPSLILVAQERVCEGMCCPATFLTPARPLLPSSPRAFNPGSRAAPSVWAPTPFLRPFLCSPAPPFCLSVPLRMFLASTLWILTVTLLSEVAFRGGTGWSPSSPVHSAAMPLRQCGPSTRLLSTPRLPQPVFLLWSQLLPHSAHIFTWCC